MNKDVKNEDGINFKSIDNKANEIEYANESYEDCMRYFMDAMIKTLRNL